MDMPAWMEDVFVGGLFSISENTSVVAGMDFLVRCGKRLVIAPAGVLTIEAAEYEILMQVVGSRSRGARGGIY